MTPHPLSPLQRLNFAQLQLVRDEALVDKASACCRFGISLSDVEAISNMPGDVMLDRVMQLGQEALFVPREGLDRLLQAPAPLLPLVAASRPLRGRSRHEPEHAPA